MPKARFAFKPTFGSIKGNVNACDLLVTNASKLKYGILKLD